MLWQWILSVLLLGVFIFSAGWLAEESMTDSCKDKAEIAGKIAGMGILIVVLSLFALLTNIIWAF